ADGGGAAPRPARGARALPSRLGHRQRRDARRVGKGRQVTLLALRKEPGEGPGGGIMTGELRDRTVVVIGGSAGIGLEPARRARAEGAQLILTRREPAKLGRAAREVGAMASVAFDATDPAALGAFFRELPPVDHIMVTAGRPHYGRILDLDLADAGKALGEHILMMLQVARNSVGKVRPGGALLFMGGTGGRRPAIGIGMVSTVTAALPTLTANLALELAPLRVNLLAAGLGG